MEERRAKLSRETAETQITVELNIDGTGKYEVDTGNGMFDHLLAQLSRHGLMDISVSAKGDTHVGWHHLVEDVGAACTDVALMNDGRIVFRGTPEALAAMGNEQSTGDSPLERGYTTVLARARMEVQV